MGEVLPAGVLAAPLGALSCTGEGGALVAGPGLAAGVVAVFAVPVAAAPVVVGEDGRILAGGHLSEHVRLGVLEQYLPEGAVEELVAELGLDGERLRLLSAPMVVRCVMAMTLLAKADYREVMATVVGLLAQLPWVRPWYVPGREVFGRWRKAVGVEVFQRLYWLLAARVAAEHAALAAAGDGRFVLGGLLLCALDGFQARMPDTPGNRKAFGPRRGPFPLLRVVVATVCATRAQLGACFGPSSDGEQTLTARLAADHPQVFTEGRLYLTDRNFLGVALTLEILRCGAHLLMRVKSDIRLPRIGDWLPDGSYRSYLRLADDDGAESWLPVRVVEYDVLVGGAAPGELFCLVTDLLDHEQYPAAALCAAYPERWGGSETHIKEIKGTVTGAGPSTGPILRSRTPELIEQEVLAWLTSTQLVRAHGRDAAAATRPEPGPQRHGHEEKEEARRERERQAREAAEQEARRQAERQARAQEAEEEAHREQERRARQRELSAREVGFTATLREAVRSLNASAVTATTSPARLATTTSRSHAAVAAQPVQVDRHRHRPRVVKTNPAFPHAGGPVRTTTARAEVVLQAPAPAARSG